MFRKSKFRFILAGLLILMLIGAGSLMAYRAGLAQGAGYEAIPFVEGEYEEYRYEVMPHSRYGFTSLGRYGHHGGYGFFGFGLLGMMFQIFFVILIFKFIFRLLFFPFGMMRRKRMRRHMHSHPGMWGWYDDDEWDDEGDDKEAAKDETGNDKD